MTARFIVCAPLELGGTELTVFAPNSAPVTWTDETLAGAGATQPSLSTDGKSTVMFSDSNGGVHRSIDGGVTWATPATHPTVAWISADTSGAGVWIAGCSGYALFQSLDNGASWTLMQVSGNPVSPIPGGVDYDIAFGNNIWFAVDLQGTDYSYSTDGGFHWTHPHLFTVNNFQARLFFDGVEFVTWGTPNGGSVSVLTCADGQNFTAYPVSGRAPWWLAANAGVYVIAKNGGGVGNANYVSVGSSWAAAAVAPESHISFPANDPGLFRVGVTTEGRIIAVGSYGGVATSIDRGATWVLDNVPWTHNSSQPTQFALGGVVALGANAIMGTPNTAIIGRRQALC